MRESLVLKEFIELGNYEKMKKNDKLKLVLLSDYRTLDCRNKLLMFTLDNQVK